MRYHVRTILAHYWFDDYLDAKEFIDENHHLMPCNDDEPHKPFDTTRAGYLGDHVSD